MHSRYIIGIVLQDNTLKPLFMTGGQPVNTEVYDGPRQASTTKRLDLTEFTGKIIAIETFELIPLSSESMVNKAYSAKRVEIV